MSSRQPLSTLPLAPYIAQPSSSSSPTKRLTPLRQSASSMSLLPSPFLPSTTPRAQASTGPLSTLYERGGGGGASPQRATRSRTPSSRLLEQEELQEQLDADDSATSTPPKRLLDLFVQSAERDKAALLRSPKRVSSPQKEPEVPEPEPAWEFYFDAESDSVPPAAVSQEQSVPERSPDGEVTDVEVEAEPPFKENVRLPPRAPSATPSTAPQTSFAPASLPGSTVPSPPPRQVPPPPNALPQRTSIASPAADRGVPKTPPPVLPHSPTYPTSDPPLTTNTEVELGNMFGFSEGATSLFESHANSQNDLNGLGIDGDFVTTARSSRKRSSDEHDRIGEDERDKRTRTN
ncbi:uncharacterized protein JCM15063_003384 [Sporobolomyces koalae]|uniref:uncharacterized protein n=1 Tax=Sporobolomyces koalae TaxID=500713 RepID=UPI00317E41D4